MTFFFSNFEDSWRAKDLFFEFKGLGDIEEIVIPAKKGWRGKKYGFVRFENVIEERLVDTKLNKIWLEGKKLSANISKYARGLGPIDHKKRGVSGNNLKAKEGNMSSVVLKNYEKKGHIVNTKKVEHKSFAEAFVGKQIGYSKDKKEA